MNSNTHYYVAIQWTWEFDLPNNPNWTKLNEFILSDFAFSWNFFEVNVEALVRPHRNISLKKYEILNVGAHFIIPFSSKLSTIICYSFVFCHRHSFYFQLFMGHKRNMIWRKVSILRMKETISFHWVSIFVYLIICDFI